MQNKPQYAHVNRIRLGLCLGLVKVAAGLLLSQGCAAASGKGAAPHSGKESEARVAYGMVAVIGDGRSFRIDRFERSVLRPGDFLSVPNQFPQTNLTADQARRNCRRFGARLCSLNEWRSACLGVERLRYSYGATYKRGRCNDGRGQVAFTGQLSGCRSGAGVHDMLGNVMEWVRDRRAGRSIAVGGAFGTRGSDCFSARYLPGRARSQRIGYRCCR